MATLGKAIEVHRAGQPDTAETLYRRTLQMQVGQAGALDFLGVLCHQRGRGEEGLRLTRMALRAAPQHADAHNNLGTIYKLMGMYLRSILAGCA